MGDSSGVFVFWSNNYFHLQAFSKDLGFEVFATIIHPDTCLIQRG